MYKNHPEPKQLYNKVKQSARKRNIPFDMTIMDFYHMDFPITCPILGIPLHWNVGQAHDDSYSFDRIDSALGYTFDNIQVISMKANRAKNNLTDDEIKKFCTFYK